MNHSSDLIILYQNQGPIAKTTLEVLALLTFCRYREETKLLSRLLSVLTGKFCSVDFVTKQMKHLKKEGLLVEQGYPYAVCPRELVHPLCVKLSGHPHFSEIVREIKSTLRSFIYYTNINPHCVLLFLSLYENDDTYAAKNLQQDNHPYWILLYLSTILESSTIEEDPLWVEQRSPLLRELLISCLQERNIATLKNIDYTVQPTLPATTLSLFILALYRGDLPRAEKYALDFTEKSYEQHVAQGILYFLHADFIQAEKQLKLAMTQWRKLTNNPKLSFQGIDGIFYLLCVVRLGIQSCKPNINKIFDPEAMGYISNAWYPAYVALGLVIKIMDNPRIDQEKIEDQLSELLSVSASPFAHAVVILCFYWLVDEIEHVHDFIPNAQDFYDFYHTQAPGLAVIVSDFLQMIQPGDYRTSPFPTLNFAKLYSKRPVWLACLEQLEHTLVADVAKKKTTSENHRVIWEISLQVDKQRVSIFAKEQKQRANGIWSEGKSIAPRNFHPFNEKLTYFSPQDKQLASILGKDYNWPYGTLSDATLNKAVSIMAGHPHLYDEETHEPVEIIKRDPALLVAEQEDGNYSIKLSPPFPENTPERKFVLQQETPTRYVLFEFSAVLQNIAKIIGKNGIRAPAQAKDFLLPLVEKASQRMEVQTQNIQDLTIPTEPGDTLAHVQLFPSGNGLKICFLVRPLGDEGPYLQPGKGNSQILMNFGQQPRHIKRDFAEEVANALDIIESSALLQQQPHDDQFEYFLNNQESCLQVLSDLQTYHKKPIKMIWPQGRKYKVTAALQPQNLSVRVSKQKQWFSLSGSLQVTEDEVIEMSQLLSLMENQSSKFVEIRPGEFIALTEHFKKQLQDLNNIARKEDDHFLIHPLSALALEPLLDEVHDLEADQAWKQQIKSIEQFRGYEPVVPATLQAELRPYQEEGFKWLARLAHWGVGACLADDMGLGKTVQTLALLLEQGKQGPSLIVAPTSVCHNWELEIARFAPTLNVHVLKQLDRKGSIERLQALDVLICSYGMLPQTAVLLAEKPWQVIVLDEAQAIKNATTKRAQLVSTLRAASRVALSGTPIENHLGELWSLFNFLNPGLFGTQKDFFERFVNPIEKDKDLTAKRALKNLLQPFILRRTKNMVLEELPDRTEKTLLIEMEPQEQAFYEALRQQALQKIIELRAQPAGQRRMCILAEITRLRRACGHPGLVDEAFNAMESGKLKMLSDLLDELIENRHKVLIFSQYLGMLEKIKQLLENKKITYQYLDGSTPASQRQKSVQAFQQGEGDVFLISLKAGGTGLNLTAANYVIHVDPWWNPAVEDQASDRAHRIGQKQPVTIYRLIVQNTIEEKILALHHDKRNLANELLDETQTSGKLTEEQLMGLISI